MGGAVVTRKRFSTGKGELRFILNVTFGIPEAIICRLVYGVGVRVLRSAS